MNADNVEFVAQAGSLEHMEDTLNLLSIQEYFKFYYITYKPNTTTFIVSHLNNKEENKKLVICKIK